MREAKQPRATEVVNPSLDQGLDFSLVSLKTFVQLQNFIVHKFVQWVEIFAAVGFWKSQAGLQNRNKPERDDLARIKKGFIQLGRAVAFYDWAPRVQI